MNPLVLTGGSVEAFDERKIQEKIDYAYFQSEETSYQPDEVVPEPEMNKEKAYSWVKAPRYNHLPFEVGPLARLILSGDYDHGISAMDRTIARVCETKKIAGIIKRLLQAIVPEVDLQRKYDLPDSAAGRGLVDTTRGALGHWLKIKDKKIAFYQIITPSTWDFFPPGIITATGGPLKKH
ncbi:nickel-dependent hydrogenase large subunit [Terrilactibacillus sp. S3-3]|nr:nickel-dependent hydrogenase large subunit [Terrilactibacillus sp. S3-3]